MLTLTITLTNQCNYSCVYCFSNNRREHQCKCNYIDFNLLKVFLDRIIALFNKKQFRFILIGGEPFLYKYLIDFCKYFNRNNIDIVICSNNSENALTYIKLYKVNQHIHYIFSWHSLKNQLLNEHFMTNIKIFQKTLPISSYELLISAEPFNFNNSLSIYKQIILEYPMIQCEFNLLTQTEKYSTTYTDFQLMEIQKLSQKYDFQHYKHTQHKKTQLIINNIILNTDFNHYNWKCDAGKTYLYIDVDGYVYRCYSYFMSNQPIQHMTSLNISNLLSKCPQTCTIEKCSLDLTYTDKFYE